MQENQYKQTEMTPVWGPVGSHDTIYVDYIVPEQMQRKHTFPLRIDRNPLADSETNTLGVYDPAAHLEKSSWSRTQIPRVARRALGETRDPGSLPEEDAPPRRA